MSQGLHQGILSFTTNGFDRSTPHHRHQEEQQRRQQQHLAQQSRRDKLRVQQQGFEPPPSLPLVAIEEEVEQQDHGELPAVYETAGTMWSEMFNFSAGGGAFGAAAPTEAVAPVPVVVGEEWYGGNRSQGIVGGLGPLGDSKHSPNNAADINRDSIGHQNHHQISSLNAESAAAMQLFLMNPQPRSPSPPPSTTTTSSTPLHLLLSNQSTTTTSSNPPLHQAVYHHSAARAPFSTTQIPFTVVPSSSGAGAGDVDIVDNAAIQLNSSSKIGGVVEGQGLSLTLSSSLQHLEAAKAASHEEFKMGEDGMLYYGSRAGGCGVASSHSYQLKNLGDHQHYQSLQLQGIMGQNVHEHIDFRSSSSGLGMISLLRNSRYVKAARELLEEFCSVGRADHLKNNRLGRHNNTDLSSDQIGGGGAGGGGSSSSSKGLPPLSAADRIDYQRKKTKLLSMLDEVGRRYNHYCEQLRTVVSSFDSVMGFGAATPYTGLAQKAMSRHFRCLKDAIIAQLKLTCELLGEKDSTGGSGVTKGETPRLRLLDQSLRQQRAFHQMGMMEQEAWRPQRGLPERSVNILRAWLFEHFLHPYPSDADKHFLSRQTGLSRNQVSNWFINARVRLWKPMVEEMYQKEAKEEGEVVEEGEGEEEEEKERRDGQSNSSTRTPTPREPVTTVSATTATSTTSLMSSKRTEINATESDPSHLHAINRQYFSENQATTSTSAANLNVIAATTARPNYRHEVGSPATLEAGNVQYHHQQQQQHRMAAVDVVDLDDTCLHGSVVAAEYRTTVAAAAATGLPNPNSNCSTLVNFRTTATTTATGDVSLTLGLRHAGNLPEKNRFSLTDFGGC